MAIVIEFYVPEKFRKQNEKWSPTEQRGTIIRFPVPEKKSALVRVSKIGWFGSRIANSEEQISSNVDPL